MSETRAQLRHVAAALLGGLLSLVLVSAVAAVWFFFASHFTRSPAVEPSTTHPEHVGGGAPRPEELDTRLTFAENLAATGRLADAMRVISGILEIAPHDARALGLRERVYALVEKNSVSISLRDQQAKPVERQVKEELNATLNRLEAARKALDASLALSRGDTATARALIAEGEALEPASPRWAQLSRQADAESQEAERQVELREHIERARRFLEADDYRQAILEYEKAIALEPNSSAANTGITLVTRLMRTATAAVASPARPTRVVSQSDTQLILPSQAVTDPALLLEAPPAGRSTQPSAFPAEIGVEILPWSVQPGEPYFLRVWLSNMGEKPLEVKSLEIVSTFDNDLSIGRGQLLNPLAARVEPGSNALLYHVLGVWNERQHAGSIEVTVTLVGNGKLVKTVKWGD